MALKDMLALVDAKLGDVFHTKKVDPATLRAPVLKAIERTKSQFSQTEPVKGPKWFRVNNSVVALTPTMRGGHPIVIDGQTTVFIPSERFTDFLDAMTKAVNAGEFDTQIENPGNGAGSIATVKMPKARKPRAPRGGGGAGWSDERRAKFAATVAARNANKA